MTKIYELETERLYLRQWTEADRAPFAKLNADERVMEFLPRPLSRLRTLMGALASSEPIESIKLKQLTKSLPAAITVKPANCEPLF